MTTYLNISNDEKIKLLIQNDKDDIISAHQNDDYSFLESVLLGKNFTPYSQLSDDSLSNEFQDRFADEIQMESDCAEED